MRSVLVLLVVVALVAVAHARIDDFPSFQAEVQEKFLTEDFAALERLAGSFRASGAHFPGRRYPKLEVFYGALDMKWVDDTEWKAAFARFDRWKRAFPRSVTPRVAEAAAWRSYAWEARGGGYARSVSQAGWRLFGQRIERARAVAEEGARLPDRDAYLYAEMIVLDRAQGAPRATMEEHFRKALSIDAGCLLAYKAKTSFLLPRWHGEPGDLKTFAEQTVKDTGNHKIYASIAVWICYYGANEVKMSGLEWPKLKKGFTELLKVYPDEMYTRNAFALCAVVHKDRATAGPVFKSIGSKWEPGIWNRRSDFDKASRWAQGASRSP